MIAYFSYLLSFKYFSLIWLQSLSCLCWYIIFFYNNFMPPSTVMSLDILSTSLVSLIIDYLLSGATKMKIKENLIIVILLVYHLLRVTIMYLKPVQLSYFYWFQIVLFKISSLWALTIPLTQLTFWMYLITVLIVTRILIKEII